MGEEGDVARGLEGPRDDALRAAAHLLHGLTARRPACPHAPARMLRAHLGRGAALGLAIVPFEKILGGLGHVSVAGEPAGVGGAGERARQDEGEGATGEIAAERPCLSDALVRERNIRASRVATARAPFRLAVADEPEIRAAFGRGRVAHGSRRWYQRWRRAGGTPQQYSKRRAH